MGLSMRDLFPGRGVVALSTGCRAEVDELRIVASDPGSAQRVDRSSAGRARHRFRLGQMRRRRGGLIGSES